MRLALASALLAILSLFPACTDPYTHMVDRVSASIVKIRGEKDFDTFFGEVHGAYSCSGFVVAKHRVLTAAHCLGDNMTADGIAATPLIANEHYDLALLDVDTPKAPLEIRDRPVTRFEALTAIGYGFGWDQLSAVPVTVTIVNQRTEGDGAPGIITHGSYIGGMSGGPVVDIAGRVVGIVQQSDEGAGYGVGTLLIRAFLLEA